jgi:hypothetical protein
LWYPEKLCAGLFAPAVSAGIVLNLFGSIAPGHAAGLRAARFRVVLAVVDTSVAILLLRSPENVPCRNDMHKTYSKRTVSLS